MTARIIIVPTGKTGPSGSISAALDDLTDVTITAAAAGDILRHNGTAWVDAVGTTHFDAAGTAAAAVAAHEADTTNVHGIADTSALVTSSGLTTTLSSYLTTAGAPELIRDTIGTALTAGAGITITPNDGSDIITVASSITQYTDEMARDALGTALVAGSNITITPNDGSDTITIAASGGDITAATAWAAKGDLIAATGNDAAAIVSVGANGTILMADSSTSTGVAWARPQLSQQLVSGRYYMGVPIGQNVVEGAAWVANQVVAHPFYVPTKVSIDRLGFAVTTAVASSTAYIGLYLPDDTGGLPGTLIVAGSGTLDTSTTGGKEYTVSATIGPGVVWAVVQTGSTATARTRTASAGERINLGRGALTDTNPSLALSANRTAADLPSSLAGTGWTYSSSANIPHGVQVRIA
jgi:hypothetical protein